MTDIESDYATTILTSNPPEQVARILPSAVDDSTRLVRDQLLPWLTQYQSLVTSHTDALRKFSSSAFQLDEGKGEYGSFPRILKCASLQLAVQIANNELLLKELRSQVINPLVNLTEKDARFLALMIYSEELRELSSNLKSGAQNAEVEWGTRAPQIIDAFANYKEVEAQLLFDAVLNFFQAHGVKWQNEQKNNENSINYLLKTYNVRTEMESYLKYVVGRDFAPSSDGGVVQQERRKQEMLQQQQQRSHQRPTDTHSIVLSASKSALTGKTSKLKSKMGTLFGRKSKAKSRDFTGTIPEAGTAIAGSARNISLRSSRPSQQRKPSQQSQATLRHSQAATKSSAKSQESRARPSHNREHSRQNLDLYTSPQTKVNQPATRFPTANYYTQAPQSAPAANGTSAPGSSTPAPNYSAASDAHAKPAQPLADARAFTDPMLALAPPRSDSPNFIQYSSLQSSESSANGERLVRRKSLLEQHDLTEESMTEAIKPSTQSSTKQMSQKDSMPSFEAGDDSEIYNTSLDPAQNRGKLPLASPFNSGIDPPMPPPARKVVHHDEELGQTQAPAITTRKSRHDIVLTLFQDMPNARHSVMVSPPSLMVQNTGGTLTRGLDVFKHSELSGPDAPLGLNASVAEVINAKFKSNVLVSAQIVGEIALSFNGDSDKPIVIEIPRSFDKVILNPVFVEEVGNNKFKVLPGPIRTKTLGAIKYLVDVDPLLIPIVLQQAWRHEDHQSSVMVNLCSNSTAHLSPLELHDLVVSIALKTDVVASLALSKPQGLFSSEKNRITWRYPAPLTVSKEEQLIARFITNSKGTESDLGLQIKFHVPNHASFDSITADGAVVPTSRSLVSGSYVSHT